MQSAGEKQVAEWLERKGIPYRYDGRLRIIEGFQIRPDFYLPELDVYIEYWGMDTPRYKAGMYLKQDLYMHAGKKLIFLYPPDLDKLDAIPDAKLEALKMVKWASQSLSVLRLDCETVTPDAVRGWASQFGMAAPSACVSLASWLKSRFVP